MCLMVGGFVRWNTLRYCCLDAFKKAVDLGHIHVRWEALVKLAPLYQFHMTHNHLANNIPFYRPLRTAGFALPNTANTDCFVWSKK
jgi:hypothetical protein